MAQEPSGGSTSPSAEVDETPDPDVLWATARQEVIPAWNARAEAALAQVEVRRAFFAGEERLEVAFPDVASGALSLRTWFDARLSEQTEAESSRVRARGTPVPPLGGEDRTSAWVAARDAALDAEDLAASLERRLLLALRALVVDHPSLAGDDLRAHRADLERRVATAAAAAAALDEGEARSEALADVALLQRQVARLDALAARARRSASVPGSPSPLDPSDLSLLSGPEADFAADRLERVRPLLGVEQRRRVDRALLRWLSDVAIPARRSALDAAPPAARPPDVVAAELVEARARLAQAERRLVEAGESPDASASPTARRGVLEARVELHSLTVRLLDRERGAAEKRVEETQAKAAAEKAAARADEARKEAVAAARAAKDDTGRRLAEVLDRVATAEAAAEDEWAGTRSAEEAFSESEAEWDSTQRELDAEVSAILQTVAGIGSEHRQRTRDTWEALHDFLTELREAAIRTVGELDAAERSRNVSRAETLEQRAELEKVRAWVLGLPTGESKDAGQASLETWEAALSSRSEAAEKRLEAAEDQRDRTFVVMRRVKDTRERLRPEVPGGERVRTSNLFHDIALEVRLFAPNLRALARRRLAEAASLPVLLTKADTLAAFIVSSFWLILVLVIGLVVRARLPRIVEPMVLRLNTAERQLFERDFKPLVAPVTLVAVAALDLLVLTLLLGPVRERLPELGILLVLLRIVAVFRLLDGLFRLAVAPVSQHRPALVTVRDANWPLVARAERMLILWLLLGTLVQYVVGDLIGAEALAWVIAQGFLIAFLVLSGSVLHLAEPQVRIAIDRRAPDGVLKRSLAGESRSNLVTRAPRAAIGLSYLLALRGWQLLQGNVEEGTVLGQVLNVVNRRRLTQQAEEPPEPIPVDLASRLSKEVSGEQARALYPEVVTRLDASLASWASDGNLGLFLLVGDRGQGKHALVNDWAPKAAAARELEHRSARLGGRVVGETSIFKYLARLLALEGVEDAKTFERAVKQLPSSLFVIEELENAFLRRVGGFHGLRALFRVLTAACDKHYWVLTVHSPAWRLLERLGTVVHRNSFRDVVSLPRLGGGALETFLVERTEAQSHRADFGPLSQSAAPGQPAAEIDRTAEAYFRLLAESALGNVGVAIPLWTHSLTPMAEGTLRVRLPEVISNPQLPPLSDVALLSLAAVRVHGGLTLPEIVEVNNLETDLVAGTVQILENHGLLVRTGSRYRIEMRWLAAITRLLRRRHFVYGKDVA